MMLLKVFAVLVSVTLPGYSAFSSAVTPENIISLTNDNRTSLGLAALSMNERLMQAAQAKAEDMLDNQYFAHTSPDGVTPWYWLQAYGYNYRSAGENLAAHFTQAEDVNAGWMASPAHRDNILSDRYNEIGVGVAQGTFEGYSTTFVVQMFGFEQITSTVNQEPVAKTVVPATPEPDTVPEPTTTNQQLTQPESKPIAIASTPKATPAQTPPEPKPVEAATIDISSLILIPTENGYNVSIGMDGVREAALNFGSSHAPLEYSQQTNSWLGTVLYDATSLDTDGEQLYAVVTGQDNRQQIIELTTLMPNNTPTVYAAASPETSPKLFGIVKLNNINDSVHAVYLVIMVGVAAVLLIAIFVKIEIQKPHMVAHSLLVIALGLFLLAI